MLTAPIAYFGFHVPFEIVVMIVLSLMLILQVILFQNQLRQDDYLKRVIRTQESSPVLPLMNPAAQQPAQPAATPEAEPPK